MMSSGGHVTNMPAGPSGHASNMPPGSSGQAQGFAEVPVGHCTNGQGMNGQAFHGSNMQGLPPNAMMLGQPELQQMPSRNMVSHQQMTPQRTLPTHSAHQTLPTSHAQQIPPPLVGTSQQTTYSTLSDIPVIPREQLVEFLNSVLDPTAKPISTEFTNVNEDGIEIRVVKEGWVFKRGKFRKSFDFHYVARFHLNFVFFLLQANTSRIGEHAILCFLTMEHFSASKRSQQAVLLKIQ